MVASKVCAHTTKGVGQNSQRQSSMNVMPKGMSAMLLVKLLVLFSALVVVVAFDVSSRHTNFKTVEGRKMDRAAFRTDRFERESRCAITCLGLTQCVTYNYNIRTLSCELLDGLASSINDPDYRYGALGEYDPPLSLSLSLSLSRDFARTRAAGLLVR